MFACQGWLGVCGTGPAGLVEMKYGGFVDDVDCMGKWPGYGGYAVAMGEWPACGDLSKRIGRWLGYEDLSKRMGKFVRRVAVWGSRDTYGEMACVGSR